MGCLFLGCLYAMQEVPVWLARSSRLGEQELEAMVSTEGRRYLDAQLGKGTNDSAVAREAYQAAIGRNVDGASSSIDRESFAEAKCPRTMRVVSDIETLGESTANDLADDVRSAAFASVSGLIPKRQIDAARLQGLVVAVDALSRSIAVDGIDALSFRVPLPAHPRIALSDRLNPNIAAAHRSLTALAAVTRLIDQKVQPVAVTLFGGSRVAVVEAALEIRPPIGRTAHVVRDSSSFVDGSATVAVPLQSLPHIPTSLLAPDACRITVQQPCDAGTALISPAPGASDSPPKDQLTPDLFIRLTYVPRDFDMLLPNHPAYLADRERIALIHNEYVCPLCCLSLFPRRELDALRGAPLTKTIFAPSASLTTRAKALFFFTTAFVRPCLARSSHLVAVRSPRCRHLSVRPHDRCHLRHLLPTAPPQRGDLISVFVVRRRQG